MAFAAFKYVPQTAAATTVAFPSVGFFFYCMLYIYTVNIERCVGVVQEFLPGVLGESYIAVMKWAVYAPTLLHPILYFCFCADARHGLAILFRRLCSCCLTKSGADIEANSGKSHVSSVSHRFYNFCVQLFLFCNYPLFGLFLAIQYYMFSFN